MDQDAKDEIEGRLRTALELLRTASQDSGGQEVTRAIEHLEKVQAGLGGLVGMVKKHGTGYKVAQVVKTTGRQFLR